MKAILKCHAMYTQMQRQCFEVYVQYTEVCTVCLQVCILRYGMFKYGWGKFAYSKEYVGIDYLDMERGIAGQKQTDVAAKYVWV